MVQRQPILHYSSGSINSVPNYARIAKVFLFKISFDSVVLGFAFLHNANATFSSYNKTQLDALISQFYFWNKTLHVSDSSSVYHQEFFTVHTAIHTGLLTASEQAVSKLVWHIRLLYVQWKTPDDGQRNCPKHVEFYSKNKFEKLVYLVGFIIRIFHDAARSAER